jgi:hypothetical protein
MLEKAETFRRSDVLNPFSREILEIEKRDSESRMSESRFVPELAVLR